ncbi:MAG: hypothetical protein RIT45_354 [Pseudomonadota bacterium]
MAVTETRDRGKEVRILVLAVLVAAGVGFALASSAVDLPSPADRAPPDVGGRADASVTATPRYRRSRALIVGVDAYDHLPPLRGAERDARAVAAALARRGFEVEVLLGAAADRAALLDRLQRTLPSTLGREDRLVVYLAGHGVAGPAVDGELPQEGYFLPAAADPAAAARDGVGFGALLGWLDALPARHVLLLADACHAGLALTERGAPAAVAADLRFAARRPVRVALVAGARDEPANALAGRGVFTRHVLRGIDGAADANADGWVSSDELVAYVRPAVARDVHARWGAAQHPQSARRGEGTFFFATQPGGPTLSEHDDTDVAIAAAAVETGEFAAALELRRRELQRLVAGARPQDAGARLALRRAEAALVALTPPRAMAWHPVPAGAFRMGSPPDARPRDPDEREAVVVLRHAFELAETEVTQAQWAEVMGTTPSTFADCGGDCPVEDVTFWDALAYCNARSASEGLPACYALEGCDLGRDGRLRCDAARFSGTDCRGYRLPTEAEWERAAAGADAPGLDAVAWYAGRVVAADQASPVKVSGTFSGVPPRHVSGTFPVAQLEASPGGHYDLLGNVWEWTWSGEHPGPHAADGPARVTPARRVARGGGWYNPARDCRVPNRFVLSGDAHYFNVGLRLARTLPDAVATAEEVAR